MRQSVKDLMDDIQRDMESLGCMPSEFYIDLDEDSTWINFLETNAAPDVNIKTLTNKEELKTILRENGKLRLIIDVRVPGISGIELAEEMNLSKRAESLVFISSSEIPPNEMDRVVSMGAKFVLKDECFLEKIRDCSVSS